VITISVKASPTVALNITGGGSVPRRRRRIPARSRWLPGAAEIMARPWRLGRQLRPIRLPIR
jgi:hypothetical protein